jgi:hypothetical protein
MNILRYLKLGSRKHKKVMSKDLVNTLFLNSRSVGTVKFYLNGRVAVKDANGNTKYLDVPHPYGLSSVKLAKNIAYSCGVVGQFYDSLQVGILVNQDNTIAFYTISLIIIKILEY